MHVAYHWSKLASLSQREALEGALKQLWVLDALDIDGGITPLGRQMVSLPLEPSLARALIAATQLGCLSQATTAAAMLSAESIFQGNRLHSKHFHLCNIFPGIWILCLMKMIQSSCCMRCPQCTAILAATLTPDDLPQCHILTLLLLTVLGVYKT